MHTSRPRIPTGLVLPLFWALLFPVGAGAAVVTATWTGGAGSWSNAAKWSGTGGVVPNNGTRMGTTYNVLIDGGKMGASTVTLDVSVTVDNLTLDAGDALSFNDGRALTLAGTTINNSGSILLNSSGGTTDLRIGGANVSLTGGGAVTLSNNFNNRILGNATGSERLTNVNNTISGAGQIGVNFMAFTNQGVVTANLASALTINPSASGVINSGTLRAATGGKLIVSDGSCDNGGGLVRVESFGGDSSVYLINASVTGGAVDFIGAGLGSLNLSGGSISGGTVTNNDNGTIRAQGGVNTLAGAVTNPVGGKIIIDDGATLTLVSGNTYSNSGSLALNSTGSNTDLRISGANVSLTGGGSVDFSANGNNRIFGNSSGAERLTNINNTIHGAGTIGSSFMAFTNQGTVTADVANPLVVAPSSSGAINSGTLSAASGGTLTLTGATLNNAAGLVRVDSSIGASIVNLTSIVVNGGGAIDLIGAGAGQLNLDNTLITVGTVTNNATGTIRARSLVNSLAGTITNPAGGEMSVDSTATLTLAPASPPFTTSGTVKIQGGGALNMATGAGYRQTAGLTTVNGALHAGTAAVEIQAGTLNGSGGIQGAVSNAAQAAPGTSPGSLAVSGSFAQLPAGTLAIELGGTAAGTGYDQVALTGAANLAGTLTVSLVNGFSPPPGSGFVILQNDGSDAVGGTFSGLTEGALLSAGPSLVKISYAGGDGNDVVLTEVGLDFFTLPPCRVFDSRGGSPLSSGVERLVELTGLSCGVPASAKAVAINLTAANASAGGSLALYPQAGHDPLVSAIHFRAGQTRANNSVMALDPGGAGTLVLKPAVPAAGSVDAVIDVCGYFAPN